MNCIKCAREIPPDSKFCPYCGKPQVPAKKHRKRPNGAGSIVKLSGNRSKPWAAKKDGVFIGTYTTRAEAAAALSRLVDTPVNERFNLTFRQIYDLWLPVHSRTIGAQGQEGYKTALNNCKELHDMVFRKIHHSDFQNVIIRLEEEGLSKSSCEKVLQLFGQLSEWAISEEIIQVNRAKGCSIVAQQKSTGLVIPDTAIKKIEKSKSPAASIVLILLATGCRPNELFKVELKDCYDTYFIGGSKTKAGKRRTIVVNTVGLQAYQSLLHDSAGEQYLIDGYKGNHTYANFAKRDWKALCDDIGLVGYTPYDCRHTYITNAHKVGVDPQILRRQVGHADLSTTDKFYTHTADEEIISALSAKNIFQPVGNKLVTQKNRQK